jgi:uncharacterized protein
MRNVAPIRSWIVTDGKAGMESQCRGLAEALGLSPEVKRIAPRAPWRWLPPQAWVGSLTALSPKADRLLPPWPDLIIATGRQTVAPALAAKRASGGATFLAQIQNPGVDPARFDLVIAPEHDGLAGHNVLSTLGALTRVTPARLAAGASAFQPMLTDLPRPLVAVLLGGPNKVYRMSEQLVERLGEDLAGLVRRQGCGLAISASRRTGAAAMARLRRHLRGLPAVFWEGEGPNPYFGFLALADAILVTADSINMLSEAASTGKPVHVIDLEGGSAKFRRFHERLSAAGATRPFTGMIGDWRYQPLDETARAAAELARRLEAHRAARKLQ